MKSLISAAVAALFFLAPNILAADSDDGYIGYRLEHRGDPESAIYETDSTSSGLVLPKEPDVFLNASVSVGLIDIQVDNITAKVNLDAQVLKLLRLNAGVDASIDRVKLTIENVSAKVELEARLENVVAMVDDVLSSIDLNPIIATLGQEVAEIVNTTIGGVGDILGGGSGSGSGSGSNTSTNTNTKRSDHHFNNYNLEHNILYSINDYTGHTHTNRVLAQNGDIYDEFLDNDGTQQGEKRVVGYYARDMQFNGHNKTIEVDGEAKEFELQYLYAPFPGIEVTSWVYVSAADGSVTRTQVIAEAFGGGGSTISNDSDL
ncbi:hypothetical protein NEMBOFW57_001197 [Staphylotrichum longicolle]|uniref:Uncharacterized protein n=1 Tax=Staphylotrichum longicolle TaxID=669026 RepID=A0AAD4F1V7_9PEZI|nr:hypothetical protein NEMBOFW57_001197 [Staphylotrichum longicolle]